VENLNRVTLLDDNHRPKAKKIEGLTPAQRRQGRRLSLYHNMHRRQLQEVADVMAQVGLGMAENESLGRIISNLAMKSNFRNFGNMCGEECQMLSFHHDAEEQGMFPLLHQQGDEALRKVVARLMAEHKVVHALIEELQGRAQALIVDPSTENFAATKASFADLERCVQSHFGYEETELEDALSVIDIGI
jgi:iron-sulfur cluster repair protein YtfE (RIC family)